MMRRIAVDVADLAKPPLLQRMVVGSWVLISINTLIFGFVLFLPQFFLRQGLTITNSLAYTVVLSVGSLVGCAVGAYTSDAFGRRTSIIGVTNKLLILRDGAAQAFGPTQQVLAALQEANQKAALAAQAQQQQAPQGQQPQQPPAPQGPAHTAPAAETTEQGSK